MTAAFFAAVLLALGVLFAAGMRLPLGQPGWQRWAGRIAAVAGGVSAVVLANVALYRHDLHFDLTASRAFTPAPEVERFAAGLKTDVDLVYFYQKQDPAGRAAKTLVEIMGRTNPRLHVRTVDPDQSPGVASKYGVSAYNVAVLEAEGRRLQIVTTSDRDIALGIVRVTRLEPKTVCFLDGHAEYDIANMEFHTHFEGVHDHSHGAEGAAVVLMQKHGMGRLRRALEALGIGTRKLTLATAGGVPADCSAVVDAAPRTSFAPPETAALAGYLARGGAALLLYDLGPGFDPQLAALLARVGLRMGEGVVVDPKEHYFTDEQMVAVGRYASHPATEGLSLAFFPGARPVDIAAAAPEGLTVTPLFSSSDESHVHDLHGAAGKEHTHRHAADGHEHVHSHTHHHEAPVARGARTLAAAVEGVWPGGAAERGATAGVTAARAGRAAAAATAASGTPAAGPPFRLVVVGDADFASNSFFPYMANADFALAALAWLLREERAPTVKPAAEVLPRVTLTGGQVQGIFLFTVVALPGLAVAAGGVLWWRRRR
jgi:ABC-type uncharacterized transport system involved in gliding motility auxiliary subunit